MPRIPRNIGRHSVRWKETDDIDLSIRGEDIDDVLEGCRRARMVSLLVGMLLGAATAAALVTVAAGASHGDVQMLGSGIGLLALMMLADALMVLFHSGYGG